MPGFRRLPAAQKIVLALASLAVLGGGALLLWSNSRTASQALQPGDAQAKEVRATVVTFGSRLQNVSLLAPQADLNASMEAQYGGLVSPQLIGQWEAAPSTALGRLTSSPWPARIDIVSITKTGDTTYVVEGSVAEETSAGAAASYPIVLTLQYMSGAWLITGVQQSAPPAHE